MPKGKAKGPSCPVGKASGQNLRQQLDTENERLRQVGKELALLRRQRQQACKATHRAARCAAEFDAAVSVSLLTGHDRSVVKQYLTRRSRIAGRSADKVEKEIHLFATSLGEAPKRERLEPESARSVKALEKANKFVKELGLLSWLQNENDAKGLAPSSRAAWAHWECLMSPSSSPAAGSSMPAPTTWKKKGQWAYRWVRRLGVRRGSFKTGERVPADIFRRKASLL